MNGYLTQMAPGDTTVRTTPEWIAELADRLAAGEVVDLEAYARAHPERAESLWRHRPALEMMADLGRLIARLIHCLDPRLRDPERTIGQSRKAVAKVPRAGRFWQTLGPAYRHAGRHDEAVEALERAFALRTEVDAEAGLVLALDYALLGREDRARSWYEKAEGWIAAAQLQGDRLATLRKEAATRVHTQPSP